MKTEKKSLNDIIRESLRQESAEEALTFFEEEKEKNVVSEAVVANSKYYPQVSEMVSEKTKAAHIELYKAYVEKLNQISAELDTANRNDANSAYCCFRSLKVEEAACANAVYLHELYFANCFSPTGQIYMDSLAFINLQRTWGTFENWQRDFIACAMSARQGWAVTAYSTYLKNYVNVMVDGNSGNIPLGLYPVLVIDCVEHAYFRDRLNDKREYVAAVLREINWDVVEDRFRRSQKIHEALR